MATKLPTRPGATDRAVQFTGERAAAMPGNVLDPNLFLFLSQLLAVVAEQRAQLTMVVKTGSPTTADVPSGEFRVIKNTSGPTYSLVVNDGGTLRSATLT